MTLAFEKKKEPLLFLGQPMRRQEMLLKSVSPISSLGGGSFKGLGRNVMVYGSVDWAGFGWRVLEFRRL